MSEEIFKGEKVFAQRDVENRQLKEENEKLRKGENENLRKKDSEKLKKMESEKSRNENEQLRKNDVIKDATIKESIEINS